MNEQKTAELVQTLQSITDWLGEEVPAFAREYILWGIMSSAALFVLWCILLVASTTWLRKRDLINKWRKNEGYAYAELPICIILIVLFIGLAIQDLGTVAKATFAPRAYLFDKIVK